MNEATTPLGAVERTGHERYTLTFERRLDHSPERVWAAITEPAQLQAWFGQCRLDPHQGGAFAIDFGDEGAAEGEVTVWDPPRLLEYTWSWEGEAPSTVRWELFPDAGGTRMVVTHTNVDRPGASDYGAGWHDFFDRLAEHLAGAPFGESRYATLVEQYRAMLD